MSETTPFSVDGFEFGVEVAQEEIGKFRGVISFCARGDTHERFEKPFSITTHCAFKTARAAKIEAEAFAFEVIKTGTVSSLLP